jgi:formylglycine-generating enzyme required for sulfatase activity
VAVLPDQDDVARDLAALGLPGRVRQDNPLGDRDKLLHALSPLLQRLPDPRRLRFSEERTVEFFAQTRLLQPEYEPCQSSAFEEVLLLLDGGVSMQVWRHEAGELRRVLASTQLFPQVRLQVLQPTPTEQNADRAAWLKAVEQLCGAVQRQPAGRSLLLLLSDVAGRHWWDGRMFSALERWGRAGPAAILQPLPMWHWARTALGAVERVSVRNSSAAQANPGYAAHPLNWWERPLPPGRDLPMPVLPLDCDALATWSAVLMGHASHACPGVALLPEPQRKQRLEQLLGNRDLSAPLPAPEPFTAATAEARWAEFRGMASADAQRLLMVMASSPLLTMPVIGLLKAATLPEVAGSLPIAEVLTSGLLARKPDKRQDNAKPLGPDQIQFELPPALANLLHHQLPAAERRDVISRVSALVERRWNRQIGEPCFEAVLCDPTVSPPAGLEGVLQFASVTARLLETLPGERARAFAERIRRGSGLPPPPPWPGAMVFEELPFEAAQLVPVPQPELIDCRAAWLVELELRPIQFTTAKLKPDLSIERSAGSTWGFHEPLQRDRLAFAATAERADALSLSLLEIPAGRFLMGSQAGEAGDADEQPQHEVELESFYLSQTPITQAQWREVAGWQPRCGERWGRDLDPEPSFFQPRSNPKARGWGDGRFSLLEGEGSSEQRPVENVSWLEAMEFCSRLSQRTARHYTLPSEAQWEYACRAGTNTPFHYEETITPALANYHGNFTYANGPKGEYRKQTTPVGMFPANAWGLQDMHGNVWEWCLDHWHRSYEGAPTDGSAWLKPSEQNNKATTKGGKDNTSDEGDRLLRGGSWFNFPGLCRSACRDRFRPDLAFSFVGLRVVCLPQGPFLNP